MKGGHAIDLDTACVCVGITGEVLMDETVYFGQLHNPNGSIRHTGDERTGEADAITARNGMGAWGTATPSCPQWRCQ